MKILVRYGEIGTKSGAVRDRFVKILRQRIEDRLNYEDKDFEAVRHYRGRIIIEADTDVSEIIAEVPGVVSVYPVTETDPKLDSIKDALEDVEVGESFGIEPSRSGEHDFDSRDIAREIGSFVEKETGAEVELDDPETWVKIEVKTDRAFISEKSLQGPGGLPVGSQSSLLSLISGGIDSPVAAYRMMVRGADIMPLYFYNKPVAAEDHLLRFKSVLKTLEKFHPSKNWEYYVVDMEEINQELMNVQRGRMILHRAVMLEVAERLAEKEGIQGIVTGESIGQKSSQTPENLARTSSLIDIPIYRPLSGMNKEEIVAEARGIGTFEEAKIDSACSSISPENPATKLSKQDFRDLQEKVDLERLVQKAVENTEKHKL